MLMGDGFTLAEIGRTLDHMAEQIDEIHRVVFVGNGERPILSRLTALETEAGLAREDARIARLTAKAAADDAGRANERVNDQTKTATAWGAGVGTAIATAAHVLLSLITGGRPN